MSSACRLSGVGGAGAIEPGPVACLVFSSAIGRWGCEVGAARAGRRDSGPATSEEECVDTMSVGRELSPDSDIHDHVGVSFAVLFVPVKKFVDRVVTNIAKFDRDFAEQTIGLCLLCFHDFVSFFSRHSADFYEKVANSFLRSSGICHN